MSEIKYIERCLSHAKNNNTPVSIVGDTYDIFNFCRIICNQYSNDIEEIYKNKNFIVIRPDSGKMEEVLPQIFSIFLEKIGYTINSKGYKIFNGIKILWGDGINEDTCTIPFEIAADHGISADSIMVGSGGGLMQANIDRDTCKFAFKASSITINGEEIGIAKDPITDPGKRSKKGKLSLVHDGDVFNTVMIENAFEDCLQIVYDGSEHLAFKNVDDLYNIRERLNSNLV